MLVWEAHRQLSLSLGDSCGITNAAIPDGVRYVATLRDALLDRAILTTLQKINDATISLDRITKTKVYEAMLPSMITTIAFALPALDATENVYHLQFAPGATPPVISGGIITGYGNWIPVELLTVEAQSPTGQRFPIPLKGAVEARALNNSRSVQLPDAFCEYTSNYIATGNTTGNALLDVFDRKGEIVSGSTIYVRYVPLPRSMGILRAIGPTTPVEFEPTLMSRVIAYAVMYGMTMAQDLDNVGQYMQFEITGGN